MNGHAISASLAGGILLVVTGLSQPARAGDTEKNADDPVAALESFVKKLDAARRRQPRGSGIGAGSGTRGGNPMTPLPPGALRPHGKSDPHVKLGPDRLIKVALQHIAEGRTVEALKTLDQGIQRHPGSARLLGIRGTIHLQKGRIARALRDLEAAVKANPNDALLLVNRAQAYRKFNRPEDALADLDKAISLNPNFVAALFNRGAVLLNQRKLKLAKADFEQCVALNPHIAAPRFNLAISLDGLGRRSEAVAEMERFIKINKNDAWTKVARQQLNAWRKDPATAGPALPLKDGTAKTGTGTGTETATAPKGR